MNCNCHSQSNTLAPRSHHNMQLHRFHKSTKFQLIGSVYNVILVFLMVELVIKCVPMCIPMCALGGRWGIMPAYLAPLMGY